MNILIVDDSEPVQEIIRLMLAEQNIGKVKLYQAQSFDEAVQAYDNAMKDGGLDVIILDGDIGGGHHGAELATLFRDKGYGGEMFAASGDIESQARLLKHGCGKAIEKVRVVQTLVDLAA